MVDSIYKWSLVAASNDAADSIINWRENQLPDTVNGSARAMMQRVAEWREDMTGSLVTAGTQPAYTLTTNAQFDTLANGRLILVRVHATNAGGASTLNVNGLGAKAIRKLSSSTDIAVIAGDLQLGGVYQLVYSLTANGGAGAWVIANPSAGAFSSGTAVIFAQATAPTGWTKQTTHNDKALRVVSGATGGSGGGATAFSVVHTATRAATGTVNGTALTTSQIPSHTHTQQGTFNTGTESADHYHYFPGGGFGSGGFSTNHTHNLTLNGRNFMEMVGGGGGQGTTGGGLGQVANTNWADRDHSHTTSVSGNTGGISANHYHGVTISGQTGALGGSAAHVHTFTSDNMDFNVAYVDTIIATKD